MSKTADYINETAEKVVNILVADGTININNTDEEDDVYEAMESWMMDYFIADKTRMPLSPETIAEAYKTSENQLFDKIAADDALFHLYEKGDLQPKDL